MKKFSKTKQGFTLIEMLIVVAIIVILIAVLLAALLNYINKAERATSKMDSYFSNVGSMGNYIENYL